MVPQDQAITRLRSPRLVLRPVDDGDVPDMVRLLNNWNIARMLGSVPHPYGEDDAQAFLERVASAAETVVFAITRTHDDLFMGLTGLHPCGEKRQKELGFWLGQPYWQRGYMSEALPPVIAFGFEMLVLPLIVSSSRDDNHASQRLHEKCGFRQTGVGTIDSVAAGTIPVIYFALTREDWASRVNT